MKYYQSIPTREQIQKLWEWCGFHYKEAKWLDKSHTRFEQEGWVRPDGIMGMQPEELFNLPPVTLNNLFRWAVPKLDLNGHNCGIKFYYTTLKPGQSPVAGSSYPEFKCVVRVAGSKQRAGRDTTDAGIALFWAIWEVIQ